MSSLPSRAIRSATLDGAVSQTYGIFRESYGLPTERCDASELMARCYATYRLVRPIVAETLSSIGSGAERAHVTDAYSLGLGGLVSLGERESRVLDGYHVKMRMHEADPAARERLIFSPLLSQYSMQPKSEAHARNVISCALRSAREAIDTTTTELRTAINAAPITIGTQTYLGLTKSTMLVPPSASRYEHEKMIGNTELAQGLAKYMHRLLHYDADKDSNPFLEAGYAMPRTLLVSGRPGTGKTMGITQAITKAQRIAREKHLAPFTIHHIGNDLKDQVINTGVQRLNEIAQKFEHEPGIHIGFIDDIDMVAFGRDELHNHPEEKKFLHAMLSWLESARSAGQRGNQMIISATNYLNMDPALLSRTMECTINAPGPQTNPEHAALLRSRLSPLECRGLLDVDDWERIGEQARSVYGFSGRDLKNVCMSVLADAEPADLFDLERYDYTLAQISQRAQSISRVDSTAICRAMERYSEFQAIQKNRAREEIITGRLDEAMLNFQVRERLQKEFPD